MNIYVSVSGLSDLELDKNTVDSIALIVLHSMQEVSKDAVVTTYAASMSRPAVYVTGAAQGMHLRSLADKVACMVADEFNKTCDVCVDTDVIFDKVTAYRARA